MLRSGGKLRTPPGCRRKTAADGGRRSAQRGRGAGAAHSAELLSALPWGAAAPTTARWQTPDAP